MSDELKPCPCCGNMHLETTANVNESNNLGRCGAVWCECGLHMSARSLEEAMARWNARAERTCRIEWRGEVYESEEGIEEDGSYFCTACDQELTGSLAEAWDDYHAWGYKGEQPFRNCPNCGAKVAPC